MAAPVYLPHIIDRAGLTVEEFDAINLEWEEPVKRERAFKELVRTRLSQALEEMPKVLWSEIVDYLSPPPLPPALQAQWEAKIQIEKQLQGLLDQQEVLLPAIQEAAKDASAHLAFRLQARQQLRARVASLEQKYGPATETETTKDTDITSSMPSKPPPKPSNSTSTIFVSIIGYRDSETQHTIRSLYQHAKYPNRIFVGVVWQYHPQEDSQLLFQDFDLSAYPSNHIRQIFIRHSDARGPCYARYLAQKQLYGNGIWSKRITSKLPDGSSPTTDTTAAFSITSSSSSSALKGEDFYLQLDSHMRVCQDWDELLLDQWTACQDGQAILTAYPPGYERTATAADESSPSTAPPTPSFTTAHDAPPLLCASHFDKTDGMLRFVGRLLNPIPTAAATSSSTPPATPTTSAPLPCLFYAAGFCFGPSSMIYDCPYDPHLCNLFFGEEVSMLARLWTHGYNMYTPTKNVIWHCWSRAYRPSFRENTVGVMSQALRESIARIRVQTLLHMPRLKSDEAILANTDTDARLLTPAAPYSLGSIRTLNEFEAYTGCNFHARSLSTRAKNGGLDPTRFQPTIQPSQLDLIMQLVRKQQGDQSS